MRCWCGYLSEVRCRLFAYGPADATAIPRSQSSLASFNSRPVLPIWCRLTQVRRTLRGIDDGRAPESSCVRSKAPRNGCTRSCLVLLNFLFLASHCTSFYLPSSSRYKCSVYNIACACCWRVMRAGSGIVFLCNLVTVRTARQLFLLSSLTSIGADSTGATGNFAPVLTQEPVQTLRFAPVPFTAVL